MARPAIRNEPATSGVTRCQPPKSGIRRDPRRRISIAATRNSAAVAKPWLTMYSAEPDWPVDVIAKMPSTMNPKCETDV